MTYKTELSPELTGKCQGCALLVVQNDWVEQLDVILIRSQGDLDREIPAGMEVKAPAVGGMYSAFRAWRRAVTRPNEATFRALIEDPAASPGRGLTWLAVAAVFSVLFTTVGQLLVGALAAGALPAIEGYGLIDPGLLAGVSLVSGLLCGLPASIAGTVLGILLFAAVVQFIAGAFGGQGRFAQMVYAQAAITAPLTILTALIGWIPVVN